MNLIIISFQFRYFIYYLFIFISNIFISFDYSFFVFILM